MWEKNLSRGKGKYKAELRAKDIYPFFCQRYPKLVETIDQKKHKEILNDYIELSKTNILNGRILDTPIGKIFIQKMKMPVGYLQSKGKLKLDFHTSMKLKKKVFHTNDHTSNFRMQIVWKRPHLFKKNYYSFLPVRGFKRALPALIKSIKNKDYVIKFISKYQS